MKMSVSEIKTASVNPRVEALRKKHMLLSEEIENTRKHISADDQDIVALKKQKLRVKEELYHEEARHSAVQ